MALRCLVFTSDEGTAAPIRQILADLGVESDPCSDAVAAVEKITNQNFQIVIIDWDKQPEAGVLLTTARERKASERALTLAIVSDDASVPGVLQAGANSILRKPISIHQATDTLTTARDLLRAKHDSATGGSHSAAAAAAATGSLVPKQEQKEATLRAGEFVVTTPVKPGAQFETESEFPLPSAQSSAIPLDPLKDLEPVASSAAEKALTSAPTSPAPAGETHGLEWYLKTRVASRSSSPATSEPPKPTGNPELLGYDQISTPSPAGKKSTIEPAAAPKPNPPASGAPKLAKKQDPKRNEYRKDEERKDERRKEAELFAYMDGERPEQASNSRFHLGKRAIFAALILASIAIAATPQAPWHPKLRDLWHRGQKQARIWLNPQPVTVVQEAPPAHEDLARPGDEYKLPVAENIPDATTDPSQIEVVPVVDPTAKKPNADAANPGQTAAPADGSLPAEQKPPQTPQSPDVKPTQITPAPVAAQPVAASPAASQPTVTVASLPPHASSPSVVSSSAPATPIAKPAPQPHFVSTPGNVPPSLRSQLAPATPDPVSKPADTALPSIEPVTVAESAERALLADQPPIPYPANAKRQQGTVVLQVFIGRDGTVQDAKFLQGSFLFARTAIDGVQQWKFKPYILNGRPVSVQTTLTMKFKPTE